MTTPPIAASSIAAQAFRLMEQSPLSSFDDDTEQARAAAEQYPLALAACLALADWSFASTLVNLPAATLPENVHEDPDLPYFYQPPGDMVRVQEVGDRYTSYRLDLVGLRASDPAPLRLRYTALITNEDKLPAEFQAAVSHRLAVALGPKYLTTATKMEALKRDLKLAIAEAKKQDSRSASAARYDDDLTSSEDWSAYATR